MRLIDAEALGYEVAEEYGADGGSDDVNVIYGMIINAPTVDIVRCKDCVCFRADEKNITYCASMGVQMEPEDFCSYGEKK